MKARQIAFSALLTAVVFFCGVSVVTAVQAPGAGKGLKIIPGIWNDGYPAVVMRGTIEKGDAALLRSVLAKGERDNIIAVLDSPGGDVREAMKIGRLLHDANAATFVPSWATCASACFYVFAGGTSRYVADGGKIGLHQFKYSDSAVENANTTAQDAQTLTSELNLYLMRAGVSPVVGTLAGAVPPESMLFFEYQDLATLKIVTSYQKDGGRRASETANGLLGGRPAQRYTLDPAAVDWCKVPIYSPNGDQPPQCGDQ